MNQRERELCLLLRDLQTKVADDVTAATQRTVALAESTEIEIAVTLQAACSTISLLAQVIEQTGGGTPGRPHFTSTAIACLMCARASMRGSNITICDLLAQAQCDLMTMEAAGIVRRTP